MNYIENCVAMSEPIKRIAEIYRIIFRGNETFLKLNPVISAYGYEIILSNIEDFERKFRSLYDLPSILEKESDGVFFTDSDGIKTKANISEALLRKLTASNHDTAETLKSGLIALIRKIGNSFLDVNDNVIDHSQIINDVGAIQRFTEKLDKVIRLLQPGIFGFGEYFAYLPEQNHITLKSGGGGAYLGAGNIIFTETAAGKLNELLKTDLDGIPSYLQLACESFLASYRTGGLKLRFIQLMFALEACFNKSEREPIRHIISRHTAILLNNDPAEFTEMYKGVQKLYDLRSDIVHSKTLTEKKKQEFELQLPASTFRLECIAREIILKLIQLKIDSKELLFEKLNSNSGIGFEPHNSFY